MRKPLYLFIAVLSIPLKAQELLWENTFGGNKHDWLNNAFQNKEGNNVFSGYSSSDISRDKIESSRGGGDLWILETDTQGNILREKTVGGNYHDDIKKTLQLGDQKYLLAGSSMPGQSGEKTEPCIEIDELWFVKLDLDQTRH